MNSLSSHRSAGAAIDRDRARGFSACREKCFAKKGTITEYDLKVWILSEFEAVGIWTEEGPDISSQFKCE